MLALSALLSLLIALFTNDTAPAQAVFWLFQVWSFIMGMMWIYMLANVIVDILVMYQCITGVSAALLGLTLLSWGNSIGDAFASVAISKKGFGEMALTGCIAGPVFNLLLGLGLTCLKVCYVLPDGVSFEDREELKLTVFTIWSSICMLGIVVWLAATNGFKMTRWHAYVLMIVYGFVIGCTFLSDIF